MKTTTPETGATTAERDRPAAPAATSGELQAFIERVIVPTLVDRWFQLEDLADRRDASGQKISRRP